MSSVNGTRMFSNTGATAYACSKGNQLIMAKIPAPAGVIEQCGDLMCFLASDASMHIAGTAMGIVDGQSLITG